MISRGTKTITDDGNTSTTEDSEASGSLGQRAPGVSTDARHVMDGARIKHYTIVRALGRGGTAEVFLALDRKLERLVALKWPFQRNASSSRRLLAEAQILARSRHENTAVVYEINQFRGHPFMTLEYVEGQTLRDFSKRVGFSSRVALDVMIPIVRALVHIHARDVIHRDLKPENILVDNAGGIKIIDFGAAQLRSSSDTARAAQQKRAKRRAPMGTLRYMSPEQVCAKAVDQRSDIWAVGILLYELSCGEHPLAPFRSGWHRKLIDLDEPFSPVNCDNRGLAEVITRCLQKRRDERMETAEELLAALEKTRQTIVD